jgi:ATP-dependent DNA ligase
MQATAAHGGRRHAMISSSMQWHRALRSKRRGHEAVLYAFDLIGHDGDDLCDLPLIERKRRLAKLLGRAKRRSIRYSEHLTGDGPTVFDHVCRMGQRCRRVASSDPFRHQHRVGMSGL